MSLLFKRKAELFIGKRGTEGKVFKDFTIDFKVEKTSESDANRAQVSIYNLNFDNRSEFIKPELRMILKAGYDKNFDDIFSGDITKVSTQKQGPDFITTLECGEGEKILREAIISKSFKEGVSIKQILKEVVESFGLKLKDNKWVSNDIYNKGISLLGSSKNILDKILDKLGLEWSIQADEIQILSKNQGIEKETIKLNYQTGLIGSPSPREEGKGIEFTSLLQGKLIPGRKVEIESVIDPGINGMFVVKKVFHSGNTRTGEWYSKCEAVELGA